MKVGWDRRDSREVTPSADIRADRSLCDKEGKRRFGQLRNVYCRPVLPWLYEMFLYAQREGRLHNATLPGGRENS